MDWTRFRRLLLSSRLVAILKRLKDLGVRSFAVTCRATDWASVQNERTIETWFTERLVVGLFQPSA